MPKPTQVKIFDTLTNQKQILQTAKPDQLKMYVCGPTVYDRPHIGNARSVVVYDLWFRLFREIYPEVIYVRNITDIDDKINAAAKARHIPIHTLTEEITELFYRDINTLNVLSPTIEPRASKHLNEMIAMIESLLANNHAYQNEGNVMFDVSSYQDYGQLSNRDLKQMIAGARVEVAAYKKNPLDFVLWKKAHPDDDPSIIFDSPFGKGRPGWHIECSAMSTKYLGTDFDLHGGGADLQFPHHENEIAQSRCASPGSHYAKYWVHNGFLTVTGEKMSKSLGNFTTVNDLLEKNIEPLAIRYLLLATHYRKPLDFNDNALALSANSMNKFYGELIEDEVKKELDCRAPLHKARNDGSFVNQILAALADDLNTSEVLALLHKKTAMIKNDQSARIEFMQALNLLGLLDEKFFTRAQLKLKNFSKSDGVEINQQIELRTKAKQEKNWQLADQIRKDLTAKGIVLHDSPDGKTSWEKR